MTTSCSQCREIHLCSKACMKLIWKEHKRTCKRVEQATDQDQGLEGQWCSAVSHHRGVLDLGLPA